jgi:hypothetical protein
MHREMHWITQSDSKWEISLEISGLQFGNSPTKLATRLAFILTTFRIRAKLRCHESLETARIWPHNFESEWSMSGSRIESRSHVPAGFGESNTIL